MRLRMSCAIDKRNGMSALGNVCVENWSSSHFYLIRDVGVGGVSSLYCRLLIDLLYTPCKCVEDRSGV